MSLTRRPFALGLVGWPVGHSVSPEMHRAALASAGLEGRYDALPTPTLRDLEAALGRLRGGELSGLNVTLPWKLEARARSDEVSETARLAGAVNTLWAGPGGRLHGDNTDVPGLVLALAEAFPERSPAGAEVVVLGAGGAARAAVLAACQAGAAGVRIWNRTRARADALVAELTEVVPRAVVIEDLGEALSGADLLLQAAAAGLGLSVEAVDAEAERLATYVARLAPDAAVMDLVYGPHGTPWTAAASRAGLATADGLGMLVHQAALAFTRWTGASADVSAMWRAARQALAARG